MENDKEWNNVRTVFLLQAAEDEECRSEHVSHVTHFDGEGYGWVRSVCDMQPRACRLPPPSIGRLLIVFQSLRWSINRLSFVSQSSFVRLSAVCISVLNRSRPSRVSVVHR